MRKFVITFFLLTIVDAVSIAQWALMDGTRGADITTLLADSDYVYAGSHTGLYRSTDNGRSWKLSVNALVYSSLECFAKYKHDVYAGTTNGAYRSTDRGLTWSRLTDAFSSWEVDDLVFIRDTLFAATGYDGRVYKSTNFGQSWIQTSYPAGNDVGKLLVKDTTIFAIAGQQVSDGIYRSKNFGSTWEHADAGITPSHVFAIEQFHNTLIAGVKGSLWRSTDNGDSWDVVDTLLVGGTGHATSFVHNGVSIYAHVSSADINYSMDSGKTWKRRTSLGSNLGKSNTSTLVINTLNYETSMFLGNPAGILLDTMDGLFPSDSGLNRGVYSIASKNSVLYAGAEHGLHTSTNNGGHWNWAGGGIQWHRDNKLLNSNGVLYSADHEMGYPDYIHRSFDGVTWEKIQNDLPETECNDLMEHGPYIFVTNGDGVFRSRDSGNSWQKKNNGLKGGLPPPFDTIIPARNCWSNGKYLFVCVNVQGLFRSSDDGEHWEEMNTGITPFLGQYQNVMSMAFDGTTAYAHILLSLYRSTNNGTVWTDITNSNDTVAYSFFVTTIGSKIFASGFYGVWQSTDQGTTWKNYNDGFYRYTEKYIHQLIISQASATIFL